MSCPPPLPSPRRRRHGPPARPIRSCGTESRSCSPSREAFRALPPEDQQAIAKNTALIADYLARPEGIEGNRHPGRRRQRRRRALADEDKSAARRAGTERQAAVDEIGEDEVPAPSAAREGAEVAGMLLNEVKFPTFVVGLIEGVFSSIVKSSIEQMEAYQEMIAAVAKSLHQFMDDNVTAEPGPRPHGRPVPRPVRDRHRRLVRRAASPG